MSGVESKRPIVYSVDIADSRSCRSMLLMYFMFEFPCIISLYYIKNQQDAPLAVLFISNCKITLHVSGSFCAHHQEYIQLH